MLLSGLSVYDYVVYYYLAWITFHQLFYSMLKDFGSRGDTVRHLDEAEATVGSVERGVIT